MNLFVCLFDNVNKRQLFVSSFICLFATSINVNCLSVCLSVCLTTSINVNYLSACLSVCLTTSMNVNYLSACWSVCLTTSINVNCLSACLTTSKNVKVFKIKFQPQEIFMADQFFSNFDNLFKHLSIVGQLVFKIYLIFFRFFLSKSIGLYRRKKNKFSCHSLIFSSVNILGVQNCIIW